MTTHRTALVGLTLCPLLAGAAFIAPVVSIPSLAAPQVRSETVDVPLSAAAAALVDPASLTASTPAVSSEPSTDDPSVAVPDQTTTDAAPTQAPRGTDWSS